MDALMHCPSCEAPLRVPRSAAGHRARCSECGEIFTVPPADQLFEETCSTWIEQDVEEVEADRHRRVEAQFQSSADAGSSQTEAGQKSTATPASPTSSANHDAPPPNLQPPAGQSPTSAGEASRSDTAAAGETPRADQSAAQPSSAPHEDHSADAADNGRADGTGQAGSPADVAQSPASPAASTDDDAELPSPASSAGQEAANVSELAARAETGATADGESRYPQNLHVTEPVPHLVVVAVENAGVRLAFDSIWLEHPGFRASLPIRCAFSGRGRDHALVARPMVFVDQARTDRTRQLALTLTQNHEYSVGDGYKPADLIHRMGSLEGMPHPFDLPMPYYVSTRYAHMALHCETKPRLSGGITCEVVIPDGTTARQWLANVNGICGAEYAMLAADTSMLHGEIWQQLPAKTRERIQVWCKLRPRELVTLYVNDADLGHHDEGFGGLLVTDQRLVFSKHHHRGQVEHDKHAATIHAEPQGAFFMLRLVMGEQRTRMIKLRASELEPLKQALASIESLSLVEA